MPDMAARLEGAARARGEAWRSATLLVQFGGLLLGRAVGEYAISLPCTARSTAPATRSLRRAAVGRLQLRLLRGPAYLYFRRRALARAAQLRSSNRANDACSLVYWSRVDHRTRARELRILGWTRTICRHPPGVLPELFAPLCRSWSHLLHPLPAPQIPQPCPNVHRYPSPEGRFSNLLPSCYLPVTGRGIKGSIGEIRRPYPL